LNTLLYQIRIPMTTRERDTVPEVVNHSDMGVSFNAQLERDPKQELTYGDV